MNKADRFKRRERIMATKGVSILEIAARELVRREDWEALTGAVYPQNGRHWGRKKNGKPRWIGLVPPNAERKYTPIANRG